MRSKSNQREEAPKRQSRWQTREDKTPPRTRSSSHRPQKSITIKVTQNYIPPEMYEGSLQEQMYFAHKFRKEHNSDQMKQFMI